MKTLPKLMTLILCFSFLFYGCNSEKDAGLTIGKLHVSKQFPKPGDQLLVSFSTDTPLDSDKVSTYSYLVNNTYYLEDLNLKQTDDTWEATINIPDSAQAVFYDLNYDNLDNNNKKGYYHNLYDTENKPVANSNLAITNHLLFNVDPANYNVSKDSLIGVFENELANSSSKDKFEANLYNAISRFTPKDAPLKAEKKIKELTSLEAPTEKQLTLLKQLYTITKNKPATDSLKTIIIDKFPNSNEAKLAMAIEFSQTQDFEKQKELFKAYTTKFPKDKRYISFLVNTLTNKAVKNGEIDNAQSYLEHLSSKSDMASSLNRIAWPMAEKGEDLETAAQLSKKSLDAIKSAQEDLSSKPSYYSPSQYKKNLENNYHMYADTYAFILFKQGKIKDALKYQESAANHSSSSADVKERYIEFLIADKQNGKAQEKASEYIAENNATSKMKTLLKDIYTAPEGSTSDYEAYLKELEAKGLAYAKKKIKEKMIDQASFDFALKDLDGNDVSLASLKGKVVVLDFWATWCGPCIASFPAMQEAANKFKDDENVEFLFIDTMERGKSEDIKQRVAAFINNNNYTFKVLLDEFATPEAASNSKTSTGFGVSGIPTKFVIGPDGNIKFKSVGFNGQKEKTVQEMSIMVELAKSK